MHMLQQTRLGLVIAAFAVVLAGCPGDTPPSAPSDPAVDPAGGGSAQGAIEVRCERRASPDRSKISVDGNNLVPRNGAFRARVSAVGGSVISSTQQATGDEVEFDFDSNPNDIAQGATAILPTLIVARAGADVVGEILNPQGQVVASQGVDCEFR